MLRKGRNWPAKSTAATGDKAKRSGVDKPAIHPPALTFSSYDASPPVHTDQNIDLQIIVSPTDGGVVASTPPTTPTVSVAAVADAPSVSGTAVGNEDQPIALPITAILIDDDGSER